MRVAIIGDYPLNVARIQGGVQAAFAYLVKGLARIEDLQIHLVTMTGPRLAGQTQTRPDGVYLHYLPFFPRFEFARNYRTYQTHLNSVLAQIQPDVVHAQEATTHAYVALRSGYPAAVTMHGIRREDIKYGVSLGVRVRNWLHNRLIEQYNLKQMRYLIAISRYVTDYFSTQLRPDVRVYYVPNAIDENFFTLPQSSVGHTLLYAGRVIARKRTLDLVHAFARIASRCPEAQLRIAGEYRSEASYAEAIQRYIQSNGLSDRVHLLGPLAEEAVLSEFARCDILVLPSAQETTPMVIAQAMAASKPVVATPVGGVTEMVRHDETGLLVEVGNVECLAQALLRLLEDSSLRTKLGQAGYQFALENYHINTVARRTVQVYQQIADLPK
ncbi:MAG: glycosyltransferase family 4 protein [Anaerolineales bacterium]|nr:glycosyltransferase family 4 protein [Anaerolineales bacterium]